ncbi:hypothetical protein HPB51_003682 [Rhipicephalus microplus]|uniref:Uncharacterized protein n=1 Tax=Rhipicephalus microplus TaxID=6941 RepID=A0A9J6DYK6_RHIMP|nr:hypothetical protein HPB51_003682 [Rhipicephalus microplus]
MDDKFCCVRGQKKKITGRIRSARGRPALAAGAVPTLLPDLPAYLSKVLVKPRLERKRRGVPSSESAKKGRLSRRDEQEASLSEDQNVHPNARVFENDEVNSVVPTDLQALADSLHVPSMMRDLIEIMSSRFPAKALRPDSAAVDELLSFLAHLVEWEAALALLMVWLPAVSSDSACLHLLWQVHSFGVKTTSSGIFFNATSSAKLDHHLPKASTMTSLSGNHKSSLRTNLFLSGHGSSASSMMPDLRVFPMQVEAAAAGRTRKLREVPAMAVEGEKLTAALTLRLLQKHTYPNLATLHVYYADAYPSDTFPSCGHTATLEHMLWECRTTPLDSTSSKWERSLRSSLLADQQWAVQQAHEAAARYSLSAPTWETPATR